MANATKTLILFFLQFSVSVLADEPSFKECISQIQQLCPAEKNPGMVIKCLKQNEAQLSQQCKDEMGRLIRASDQRNEQGGRSLSVLGGLSAQTPPFPIISYEGIFNSGDFKITDNRFNISSPVHQTATDYLALSLATGHVSLSESLTLEPGLDTPKDLYRAEIGAQYRHQLGGYESWGIKGSLGYATDHFSGKLNDTAYSINLQYSYPTPSGGFLTWFLYMSNNGSFGNNIPIPGFLYLYRAENFTALLGFPILSLQWTPQKDRSYSISAAGPTISLESAFGELRAIQYFTTANWNTQTFSLENRIEEKERFYIEDKKVALGVRSFVFERMQIEARAGYSFDRLLYVGDSFRNMRRGSQKIDSEPFLSVSLKSTF